jgi:hypothetical protein
MNESYEKACIQNLVASKSKEQNEKQNISHCQNSSKINSKYLRNREKKNIPSTHTLSRLGTGT